MNSQKDRQKHELIQYFIENQIDEVLIDLISNQIYKYEISSVGITSAINLVVDLIENDYKILYKKIQKESIIKYSLQWFKVKNLKTIIEWPSYTKEESENLAIDFYTANIKLMKYISDTSCFTEDNVKKEILPNIKNCFEFVKTSNQKYIISLINNLITGGRQSTNTDENINSMCNDYFSNYENLKFITQLELLTKYDNSDLILEILLLLSSLCRKSGNVYPSINQLNIIKSLKNLIENCDSIVKSKVCNLIGNMCRHSEYFYEQIGNSNLGEALIKCCYDSDKNTRKFACFAIGNAAFINDKLYETFRPSIKILVELLKDSEDNTRANSAGALGNFVRCGDSLCNDIIKYKAHIALLELAENSGDQNSNLQTIKVALFALGNFCYHQVIKEELEKIKFSNRIEILSSKYKNENQIVDHINRIKKKLLS